MKEKIYRRILILCAALLLLASAAYADQVTYDESRLALTVSCNHAKAGETYSFIATRGQNLKNGLPEEGLIYLNQFKADDQGTIEVMFVDKNMLGASFYLGGSFDKNDSPHLIGNYGEQISGIALPDMLQSIEAKLFEGCTFQGVYLGNHVKSIGSAAFKNCSKLVYIRIPESVTSIADDAFEGCENLTICCVTDSEAYRFAIKHGFKTETLVNAE